MEAEAKQKGLDVMFTGIVSQEKVAKYKNAMDVMMLPSRNDGFGAVVIEAQSFGTFQVELTTWFLSDNSKTSQHEKTYLKVNFVFYLVGELNS